VYIELDPVIFSLGPLQVRWYGLMYVIGFLIGTKIAMKLARERFFAIEPQKVDLLVTYLLICMFIFARGFYVLVYGEMNSLLDMIAVWRGGLSFHGAAIGFFLAAYMFSRREKVSFWATCDNIVLATCPGLGLGRIGNFINMELYGRQTDVPWAMKFASDPQGLLRHPSQLYQSITEGVILMIILWTVKRRAKNYGVVFASFFIGYGILRYFTEFFREADKQMGYYFGGTTTMGQILCLTMILIGLGLWAYHRKRAELIPMYSKEEIASFVQQSLESEKNEAKVESSKKAKSGKKKKKKKNS
jgi:phosphatidylglycerol:prolipoprotein diacylglycerol transferase